MAWLVTLSPCTTGNIGISAFAYSSLKLMANAQKCGGVHKKRTTDRMSGAGENVFPVAAEPTRTAKLPARPPIIHPCPSF